MEVIFQSRLKGSNCVCMQMYATQSACSASSCSCTRVSPRTSVPLSRRKSRLQLRRENGCTSGPQSSFCLGGSLACHTSRGMGAVSPYVMSIHCLCWMVFDKPSKAVDMACRRTFPRHRRHLPSWQARRSMGHSSCVAGWLYWLVFSRAGEQRQGHTSSQSVYDDFANMTVASNSALS